MSAPRRNAIREARRPPCASPRSKAARPRASARISVRSAVSGDAAREARRGASRAAGQGSSACHRRMRGRAGGRSGGDAEIGAADLVEGRGRLTGQRRRQQSARGRVSDGRRGSGGVSRQRARPCCRRVVPGAVRARGRRRENAEATLGLGALLGLGLRAGGRGARLCSTHGRARAWTLSEPGGEAARGLANGHRLGGRILRQDGGLALQRELSLLARHQGAGGRAVGCARRAAPRRTAPIQPRLARRVPPARR
jgi:hypothetical protein